MHYHTGGPGCSSEVGLFFELLGPYLVDRETLEVTENPDGWDRAVNLIFVDQPVNVGFSYSTVGRGHGPYVQPCRGLLFH